MIPAWMRPLLLLAAMLAWAVGADDQKPSVPPAAQGAPPPPPSAAAAPAPAPSPEAAVPATELLSQLPKVPAIAEKDGGVWWQDGRNAYRILAIDVGREGAALLDTPIGRLAVGRKLIADATPTPAGLAALPGLLERAKAAQLKAEDLQLSESILTGIHLRAANLIVHADGVLAKSNDVALDRRADRERVAAAVEHLIKAIPTTKLDDLGRTCLEDTLRRLPREDAAGEDLDELAPSLARRIVRHGWLRQFFPEDQDAIAAIEKIVLDAERFLPVTRFAGDRLQLAEVKDAFNRSGWIISTPSRSAYTTPHSEPLYYWALGNPKPMVVIDLPPGTDPTASAPKVLGARLYQNGNLLAEWKDGKLRSDLRPVWRASIPAKSHKGIDTNAVTDFLPPHIVVTGLNGDISQLITEGGVLVPPRDASPAECERFVTDAAKILSDPARLDLLGEYILKYVRDSPDSRFPFLIGTKEHTGDIHQTMQQTLSTVTGGMVRGDCDDLAEVYETIADRQGRNAQVISLPRHAAAAFAEKKDDVWHAYVLQTGPPLEFVDPKLPNALEKAFKSFDESLPFDADGLGVLLRFSGENTRGSWRLSWRIFQEPDYARTMIDVQRDWHYQTYQRGISKMKRLIEEKNDQDNANYRELSGLYSFTGQYAKAVEVHQEAIKRTADANGRLQLAIELVMHQFDAKQEAAAMATAEDILGKQLPALRSQPGEKERMEAAQVALGQELAGALVHGKAWDLALRTIKETQLEKMTEIIKSVGEWLVSPRFNQKLWDGSPQLEQMRRQMTIFCATGIAVLEGTGPRALSRNGDLRTLARAVEGWLTNVAFHDLKDEDDALTRYALAGRYYAAMQGAEAFNRDLAQAEAPAEKKAEHASRLSGLAQTEIDLPWISISIPFWSSQVMELFARDRSELKRDQVAELGRRCAAAYAACHKLGIVNQRFDEEAHLVALISALVHRDAAVVRERLRWIKGKDDKRLRDDTAQWIGDTARFLDKDWFGEVLALWRDEVDYKPKYFWIAWRAALNGAPEHALMAAKLAAERFKDDPSFSEEYEFMKQLFSKK